MLTPNPPTDEIKFSRNVKTGKLRLVSPLCIRTPKMHVPYGTNLSNKSVYFTLSHGTEDSEFQNYLHELDRFFDIKVQLYNTKFGVNLEYVPLLKTPMTKSQSGELVVNEEALEKYGYTTDVKVSTNASKSARTVSGVSIEHAGKTVRNLDVLDFEGLVHPGARLSVIGNASLWTNDKSEVRLMIEARRIKVHESIYDSINFNETPLCSGAEQEYEALEL